MSSMSSFGFPTSLVVIIGADPGIPGRSGGTEGEAGLHLNNSWRHRCGW